MDYKNLVELYEKLDSTSKRLEKTYYISEFLKHVPLEDLDQGILLIQGRIYPAWDEHKIGVASKLVIKAISVASGKTAKIVENEWKKIGDLGKVAQKLIQDKSQHTLMSSNLTVKKVFDNMRKISVSEGEGSVDRKVKLISELLSDALSSKYVVRTVLEDLRIGVGEGSIRDALIWAFVKDSSFKYDKNESEFVVEDREKYNSIVEKVQKALDVANDMGAVAKIMKGEGLVGLKKVSFELGKPIKVMLYPKSKGMEDAFKTVGKPAAVEYKYDGFRLQVHKKEKVTLFTRRLDNVTKQFPEIVKLVENYVKGDNFVLDAEAVGYDKKTGHYLPFQNISQRIKRKYDIHLMAEKYPVELVIFDVLSFEGQNLLSEPFIERRKILEKNVKQEKQKIILAKQIITDSIKEAEKFYSESLDAGNEGVMLKNLEGIYKPGSRVGYGVKVKPVMESLDLVIVGAEWGTGKRAGWLTSFTLAIIDNDEFLEIGKVGTGFKEKEDQEGVQFEQMTNLLKPLIIEENGKEIRVKPQIVVEIAYEEIQKSPNYSSGYALRFPRIIRLRDDRSPDEADTLERIEEFYFGQ